MTKIRFSEYIIQKLQERDFVAARYWRAEGPDRVGVCSKGLYTVAENLGYVPSYNTCFERVDKQNQDVFEVYTFRERYGFLYLKTRPRARVFRAGKELTRVSLDEQAKLYDAVDEALEYWDQNVAPKFLAEYEQKVNADHWWP